MIPVAIIGLGNCASSLTQGVARYRDIDCRSPPPGIMNPLIDRYTIGDIHIAAAFDVNANKVGRDIAEAIHVRPNNARTFAAVAPLNISVSPGFIGDGVSTKLRDEFPLCEDPGNVVRTLRESGAQVAVNLLPTGSEQATHFYAQACIDAGVAFINGIPVPLAADTSWERRFSEARLPCAGDDVMSQLGATYLNVELVEMMRRRGIAVVSSHQTNIGGNMDFKNLADDARIGSKLISKRSIVVNAAGVEDVWAGPTGFVPELGDRKIATIKLEGRQFGDIPIDIEARISVDDSPNCAGILVDAIRLMAVSRDRGLTGSQAWSVNYFKRPPSFTPLQDALRRVQHFLRGT